MPAKKKTVTRKRAVNMPMPVQEKKTVRITEADNGFTVSSYGPKGEQIKIAKTHAEAMRHIKDMFGTDKK